MEENLNSIGFLRHTKTREKKVLNHLKIKETKLVKNKKRPPERKSLVVDTGIEPVFYP